MKRFDAIIIGGGQAGIPLAQQLAGHGWQVVLVERLYMGGSCINYGCTPTKKMVAAARVAHLARRAPEYGVFTGEVQVNLAQVVEQKDALVKLRRSQLTQRAEENENIHLVCGEAHFVDDHTLEINQETYSAEKVFINTGARPVVPPIPGLADAPYLTNRNIMDLNQTPEHLLVLGGGYVGLEFGQMFRRFGSQVTVIERNGQIAPHEDADVAQALQAALEKEGIRFHLGTTVEGVEQTPEGGITLALAGSQDGAPTRLSGSHLLVAVGQQPNSDALNLPAAGVAADEQGYIQVNPYLETNVSGIYAMGDVKGGPKFTHISYNDYQVVYHNLFHEEKVSIQDRIVPYAVFTDPELGRVGMTEKEARRSGRRIRVGQIPMSYVARAVEMDETEGLMKIVVDSDSQQILGAAILSTAGGELVQALMGLMLAGAPWTVFRQAVYIHPTLAEGFFSLMEAVD